MKRFVKILTLAVLVLQLCMIALPEAGHDDVLWGGLGTIATFTTHDCGAHERHKPIDPNHVCQACFRHANSTANTSTTILSFSVSASPEYLPRFAPIVTRSFDYYTSASKRGPPTCIA